MLAVNTLALSTRVISISLSQDPLVFLCHIYIGKLLPFTSLTSATTFTSVFAIHLPCQLQLQQNFGFPKFYAQSIFLIFFLIARLLSVI